MYWLRWFVASSAIRRKVKRSVGGGKGYNAIKITAAPVQQLRKPGVEHATALALSNQGRVCGEHNTIHLRGYLRILELRTHTHTVISTTPPQMWHLTVHKTRHTSFKEWTLIFSEAPMSLRSLSESTLRSVDTLTLRCGTEQENKPVTASGKFQNNVKYTIQTFTTTCGSTWPTTQRHPPPAA